MDRKLPTQLHIHSDNDSKLSVKNVSSILSKSDFLLANNGI